MLTIRIQINHSRTILLFLVTMVAVVLHIQAFAEDSYSADKAKRLLNNKCSSCHYGGAQNKELTRISESRRTPEGWAMTIDRMSSLHGVSVSESERRMLVKYLADTQGLAPDEVYNWRYVLERDFAREEHGDVNKKVVQTCARCHSYARIPLQRRTQDDWVKLANFHVGHLASIEIQAGGRSMHWWDVASKEIPKILSDLYPYKSKSWDKWKNVKPADLSGSWRIVGHRLGWGDYEGYIDFSQIGVDNYKLSLNINYENGKTEKGSGSGTLYTGFEWRSALTQGGNNVRQVMSLSEDGKELVGRWHVIGDDGTAGTVRAKRVVNGELLKEKIKRTLGNKRVVSKKSEKGEVLSVIPAYIRAGEKKRIAIHGVGLNGAVKFNNGLSVINTVSKTPNSIVVDVVADDNVKPSRVGVKVGKSHYFSGITVFDKVNYIKIRPEIAMAKTGGFGGKVAKRNVQFEAVGFTENDIEIGVFPAKWSLDNYNESAAAMKDLDYAGKFVGDNGLFVPGDAGTNPDRKYSTNNAGELSVIAEVDDQGRKVSASSLLNITVQRFSDPLIH